MRRWQTEFVPFADRVVYIPFRPFRGIRPQVGDEVEFLDHETQESTGVVEKIGRVLRSRYESFHSRRSAYVILEKDMDRWD